MNSSDGFGNKHVWWFSGPSSKSSTNMSSRSALENAQIFCRDNPKSPLCNDVPGFYEYRIDLAPNAAFLGIFGASLVAYTLILIVTRRGVAFNVAVILGLICEVLGYLGRILSWHNPWDENGFMIQICCLTIGPAFMAAGCYLCLRRIVSAFGPENSRLPPEYYTRIVSACHDGPQCPFALLTRVNPPSSSPATSSRSCCRPWAAPWPRRPRTTTSLPVSGPTS